jgi:hypothetical protein
MGRLNLNLKNSEKLVASPVLGIILAGWAGVLISVVSKSIDTGIIVVFFLMIIAILILRPKSDYIKIDTGDLLIILSIAALSLLFMYTGMLNFWDNEYHIAFPIYGDSAFHSSVITSFSQGYNFPPAYPMMDGQPLRYTFLIDFYSAMLDRLGMGLQWSAVLPGTIILCSLLSMLYFLAVRFTGEIEGGILSLILLVFSGGLGFLLAYNEWKSPGMGILQFLTTHNLNYTTNYDLGYVFTNFMIIVMAQRTALIGFAAGMLAILIFYSIFVDRKENFNNRDSLLLAGTISGLLPMFHMYSYICVMIAGTLLMLLFKEKKWYFFLVPAILLALPQAYYISGQVSESFITIINGWMIEDIRDFPMFWIKNMGFSLLLLLIGLFLIGHDNIKFYLPFFAIFIFANLIVLQPWDYDNHKYFSFWLMPSVIVMAVALLYVYRMPSLGKVMFGLFLILSILTGLLVAIFMIGQSFVVFTAEDVTVADMIKEKTPPDSVFITGNSPANAAIGLAGRRSYLGYGGWLYTHGIDYGERENTVRKVYAAENAGETLGTLRSLNVSYVYISPHEWRNFLVNESFFNNRLEPVINWTSDRWGLNYRVYKVPV